MIAGPDSLFTTSGNWTSGVVPPVDGSARLVFPSFVSHSGPEVVTFQGGSLAFHSLVLEGYPDSIFSSSSYGFTSAGSTTLNLANGITKDFPEREAGAHFSSGISINLSANQTWTANFFTIDGSIGGPGKFTYAPTRHSFFGTSKGFLSLNGSNNFAGGFEATNAQIQLGHANALAGGPIKLTNVHLNPQVPTTFSATVTLGGAITIANFDNPETTLHFGPVILSSSMNLTVFTESDDLVSFGGTIGEMIAGSSISVTGGPVLFEGNNSTGAYTGGTFVGDSSALIFTNANSVPGTGLIGASADGYVGAGFVSGVQASLVNRLDATNFLGTLGFDTDPDATSINVFAEGLNLSALASFRGLGTITGAAITGPITIGAGQNYRFSGGGGKLFVSSSLSQSTSSLVMDGPAIGDPMRLTLQGSNSFGGGITVSNGILVFDSAGALPATGSLAFGALPGYVGATDNAPVTFSQLIGRFSSVAANSVVGLDKVDLSTPRSVNAIDLTDGGRITTPYYLGTASRLLVNGPITAVGNRLFVTGVGGGELVLNTSIGGPITLLDIGLPVLMGDSLSAVRLNVANTHTGGTLLRSGMLTVAHRNALGPGELSISTSADEPHLTAGVSGLTGADRIPNNIFLGTDLALGTPNNPFAFELSGVVSGNASLMKLGTANITLSGANTFSQGLKVSGPVTLANNSATGTGILTLMSDAIASFTTAAPVVNGLEGDFGSGIQLAAGSNLTIEYHEDRGAVATSFPSYFGEYFNGTIQGTSAGITKEGDSTLVLTGNNTYSGPTVIRNGLLVAQHNNALGSGLVTLDGGRLIVEKTITIPNSVAFGGAGGRLGGGGAIGGSVVASAGATLAPGNSVGAINFNGGLTIGSGSTFDFEVQDASGVAGVGYDTLNITGALTFTSTAAAPATLRIISLGSGGSPGSVANFSPTTAYTWQIASTTLGVAGLADMAAIAIDTSAFSNALNDGIFSVGKAGDNLVLNFTPIPEPSTWVMLLGGTAALCARAYRRRR